MSSTLDVLKVSHHEKPVGIVREADGHSLRVWNPWGLLSWRQTLRSNPLATGPGGRDRPPRDNVHSNKRRGPKTEHRAPIFQKSVPEGKV